jgi:hypothetical protein
MLNDYNKNKERLMNITIKNEVKKDSNGMINTDEEETPQFN